MYKTPKLLSASGKHIFYLIKKKESYICTCMHRMSMYVLVVFVFMCVSTHTSCIDYIHIYLNAHVVRILCIHLFDISFCTDISLIHMVQNYTQL